MTQEYGLISVRYRWFGLHSTPRRLRRLFNHTELMPSDACSTIQRSITYGCTHAFMSECQMLLALFPDAHRDHSQWCDSCQGRIGGPRLFCLDCAIKSTEAYDRWIFAAHHSALVRESPATTSRVHMNQPPAR
ncbi:hypothetical protein BJV77DRAFT_193895 [Russula vinacea]|nr:hypothetical protein BJV77DRAFT_193895 [Russula vinacea]